MAIDMRCEGCGVGLVNIDDGPLCPACKDEEEDTTVKEEKATLLVDAIADLISASHDAGENPESMGDQRRLTETTDELKRLVVEIL